MKKGELVDVILRRLAGGDPTPDFSIKRGEIELSADAERDKMAKINLFQNMEMGEAYFDENFLSTYEDVAVSKSTGREEYYAILPAKPVSAPSGRGIHMVSGSKGWRNPFIPMFSGATALLNADNDKVELLGSKGYYQEGGRIYFVNVTDADGLDKIMLKMVSVSASIEEEEEYPMPPDMEADLIQTVVEKYAPSLGREDVINDNR